MNLDCYPVYHVEGELTFYFLSNNKTHSNPVFKIVTYIEIEKYGETYFNLAFGDYDKELGDFDDMSITNNGDMRKVLSTVVSTLTEFFKENPHKSVHIEGSNNARKDYYHKLINDYSSRISKYYGISGCNDGLLEKFQPGKKYEFIVVTKNIIH